jgi:hypothetical protein
MGIGGQSPLTECVPERDERPRPCRHGDRPRRDGRERRWSRTRSAVVAAHDGHRDLTAVRSAMELPAGGPTARPGRRRKPRRGRAGRAAAILRPAARNSARREVQLLLTISRLSSARDDLETPAPDPARMASRTSCRAGRPRDAARSVVPSAVCSRYSSASMRKSSLRPLDGGDADEPGLAEQRRAGEGEQFATAGSRRPRDRSPRARGPRNGGSRGASRSRVRRGRSRRPETSTTGAGRISFTRAAGSRAAFARVVPARVAPARAAHRTSPFGCKSTGRVRRRHARPRPEAAHRVTAIVMSAPNRSVRTTRVPSSSRIPRSDRSDARSRCRGRPR